MLDQAEGIFQHIDVYDHLLPTEPSPGRFSITGIQSGNYCFNNIVRSRRTRVIDLVAIILTSSLCSAIAVRPGRGLGMRSEELQESKAPPQIFHVYQGAEHNLESRFWDS
jgi:hypothetical protein